ncbi:50S ribosomal protein L14 [Candidatus Shapirobacteria bacterium CG03_land_8_20_14_0_80_40_19]|uniref:Large ribosomal subunit protein uL14 n=4 Tax=Candidatus Shapironibacteriota TaxID=1752721 RepID=A0A2M7BDY5_9BACT|nr:MAG: 50S ribosomal protein L14 [Candidatus Shapirobacteria bacterium CG11_big_fil_rev_8_21_14_0_20_40_12]PIV01325.1 MAG: 50S ribosomal protein L14 [Candidatus Shapirobacteria bacterium CG03_land_8_20_14_0_80_40_19]PJC29201.1 MAG: 50S ribosomal protein L14 [Candidatus Shapirobacteria bacterium CG_4_9_14_0_2_um_filter_40_11]PJC76660.1 MAG: 50S ribosomal protein L14 [Candidatus Shapirobacteria bacterium CG_4_8_14_3_um_filter_39_11]
MVQLRTILTPADNCGARRLRVIHIYTGFQRTKATMGETVLAVVDGADPNGVVKDSEKVRVVIVRAKKGIRRTDGTHIRFDDNAGVIIDKEGNPIGTRVFGPVAREVKEKGFNKIASLAKEMY